MVKDIIKSKHGALTQMVNSPGPDVSPKSNFDLLLEHLPKDGLAATLVTAHVNRGVTSSADAMRQVLKDRLATLRAAHAERSESIA
jgi:hypothetical protein